MQYYTDASRAGRSCFHKLRWDISVTESPDNPSPIGRASESGKTSDGQAAWSLEVNGAAVPGRFVVVDGQFMTAVDD